MNPSFYIQSASVSDAHLFLFAGKYETVFAVLNRQRQQFEVLCVYHYSNSTDNTERLSMLQQILEHEELQKFYSKTDIIWCTPQSIITPQLFFNRDDCGEMLNLVYGDSGAYEVKYELVLKQQAYNVYREDAVTVQQVIKKFPGAVQWHQSTPLLNLLPAKRDLLYCNFSPASVTIMLRRQNQLQVIQTFEYSTSEDAAYHLLNTCQNFGVTASEIAVTASGMIDESSGLYKELYKYFSTIEFMELPDVFTYSDEIKTYPSHYFSHYFATAACVL